LGYSFLGYYFCAVEKSIKSTEHKIIADMLYQLRMAKGLKQLELAMLLDEPQSFVSKYESGERRLDLVELHSILIKLDTNLIDFTIELENRLSKT
jgi:transcriptional regulator with XRE-family HTH domain